MIVEVDGRTLRLTKPGARAQYDLLRRLVPLLPALEGIGRTVGRGGAGSFRAAVEAVAPLGDASESDLDFILDACMSTCAVQDGDGWRPLFGEAEGLDLSGSMQVVAHVVAFNFAPFFALEHPTFPFKLPGLSFQPMVMPNGLDWLLRPVLRGLCRYESTVDGTLSIEHFAEMNDFLDVADENQARAQQAAEKAKN